MLQLNMEGHPYRVSFNPSIERGVPSFVKYCKDIDTANEVLDTLAFYTLFLHEKLLMDDYSNMAYIEVLTDSGVWEEVDEDGEDGEWELK